DLLKRVPPDDIAVVVSFLSGSTRQGRIGIGGAMLSRMRDVPPADIPSLDVRDVDAAFDRLAATSGAGSAGLRSQVLRDLFARATGDEQGFLVRLLFGELRQGAVEGVLIEAIARASGIGPARLRRAVMLAGELPSVARSALIDGDSALSRFILE